MLYMLQVKKKDDLIICLRREMEELKSSESHVRMTQMVRNFTLNQFKS